MPSLSRRSALFAALGAFAVAGGGMTALQLAGPADGMVILSSEELDAARYGAALDAADPSLFYGEARQLRLGIEVTF